jgi:hypothetical protein
MYGAGIGYFTELFKGSKIEITAINGERNPSFPGINPEPIAKNLEKLSRLIKEQKANVGIANDGDADRIGIVDEKGNFINQLQVFALLVLYFLWVYGAWTPLGAHNEPFTSLFRRSYMWQFFEWKISLPVSNDRFPLVFISDTRASLKICRPAMLAGKPAYASHDLK